MLNESLKSALMEWTRPRSQSQDRIQWFFNPASAPHFGGGWERLVKSAKKALRITLNGQLVNDETLLTLMAEIESLLTSQPLTRISVDP